MKIIFDFDHTIFDTASLHEDIVVAMEALGIDEQKYKEAYDEVTQWKMFRVESLASHLEKRHSVNPREVTKALNNIGDRAEFYVYDDFKDYAKEMIAAGHELYLLSWGDEDWQMRKIQSSGVAPFFKKVIAVSELKVGYLKGICCQKEGIVFIDDKPAQLKAVNEMHRNFYLIRMRRPNGKYSDQQTPDGVREASGMAGVLRLINSFDPEEIKKRCEGCEMAS